MFSLSEKLPEKLSDLIFLAMTDLVAIEKNPLYTVDMDNWHEPDYSAGACAVCLAGAVMAQRGEDFDDCDSIEADDWEGGESDKFHALDHARRGAIGRALHCLEHGNYSTDMRSAVDSRFDRDVIPYDRDSIAFGLAMRAIAYDLREAGF